MFDWLMEKLCKRFCKTEQVTDVFWTDLFETRVEPQEPATKEAIMAVRSSVHEINIGNFQQTGQSVNIDQYSFDLEVKWTDDDGVYHEHSGTYRYPNDLASMPLRVRRTFAIEQIIAVVRVTLGIDDWSMYE